MNRAISYSFHIVTKVYLCCRVPVLLITGAKSVFKNTTHMLHQAIVKHCSDKTKVEFIEVHGIANVLEEKVSMIS